MQLVELLELTEAVAASLPADEAERLADLHEYEILGADPEAGFVDLALLAPRMLGTPVALVNLLDSERQFTEAAVGLDVSWMPRKESFCTHTIVERRVARRPGRPRRSALRPQPAGARRAEDSVLRGIDGQVVARPRDRRVVRDRP